MGDLEDFHRDFLPRFIDGLSAFHDGDPGPHVALWTASEPATLFAARGQCDHGIEAVTRRFRAVAPWFADVGDYEWQLLGSGVSEDLAYTVEIERFVASLRGAPRALTELRSTHVFRREDGQWRAVHRHADPKPPEPGD
jgi:ketosteroid isomerase-like protein